MKNRGFYFMGAAIKVSGKLMIAIILAIIVLSSFSLFYYHTGLRVKSISGATDYSWEPNTLMSTMKEGFSWIRTDTNGYNNVSIPNQIDILLMGSSHMEAVQVAQNENTAEVLNKILPELNTYNIGISGHTIYRCVDNALEAIRYFKPGGVLIVETNRIRLDIKEMQLVLEEIAPREKASSQGKLLTVLQRIPAFKPLYTQIKEWIKQDENTISIDKDCNDYITEEYSAVLCQFLERAGNASSNSGIKTIIFYDPPQEFDEEGNLDYFHTEEDVVLFKEACENSNIIFVDMTESFKDLYATEHQLAHGFINTAVGSGHLNKYGHRVIAEKLAEVIQGLEAE